MTGIVSAIGTRSGPARSSTSGSVSTGHSASGPDVTRTTPVSGSASGMTSHAIGRPASVAPTHSNGSRLHTSSRIGISSSTGWLSRIVRGVERSRVGVEGAFSSVIAVDTGCDLALRGPIATYESRIPPCEQRGPVWTTTAGVPASPTTSWTAESMGSILHSYVMGVHGPVAAGAVYVSDVFSGSSARPVALPDVVGGNWTSSLTWKFTVSSTKSELPSVTLTVTEASTGSGPHASRVEMVASAPLPATETGPVEVQTYVSGSAGQSGSEAPTETTAAAGARSESGPETDGGVSITGKTFAASERNTSIERVCTCGPSTTSTVTVAVVSFGHTASTARCVLDKLGVSARNGPVVVQA